MIDIEKTKIESLKNLENLEKECSLLLERIPVVKNAVKREKLETEEEVKEFCDVWSNYLTKGLEIIEL